MVADRVPLTIASNLLDYFRPRKRMPGDDMSDREEPDRPFNELAETAQQEVPVRSYQGPLDFPEVSSWLQQCQDNIERGRDKHEYTKLSPVFKEHECTRIDDILTCQWGRSGLWQLRWVYPSLSGWSIESSSMPQPMLQWSNSRGKLHSLMFFHFVVITSAYTL